MEVLVLLILSMNSLNSSRKVLEPLRGQAKLQKLLNVRQRQWNKGKIEKPVRMIGLDSYELYSNVLCNIQHLKLLHMR